MQGYDRQVEHRKTRSMLFRFSLIALCMPLAAAALVFAYQHLAELGWERKEWKLAIFCFWIGTMAAMCWDAFRGLRSEKRLAKGQTVFLPKGSAEGKNSQAKSGNVERARSIGRWESKKSRRILYELCFTAFILPLIAIAFVYAYDTFFDADFERKHWKTIVFVVWIGSLAAIVRTARKAKDDNLLYQTKSPKTQDK